MLTYKNRIILCVIAPIIVFLIIAPKSFQLTIGVSWQIHDLLRGFDQTINEQQKEELLSKDEMEIIESDMKIRTEHLNRICEQHKELFHISDHYLFRLRYNTLIFYI